MHPSCDDESFVTRSRFVSPNKIHHYWCDNIFVDVAHLVWCYYSVFQRHTLIEATAGRSTDFLISRFLIWRIEVRQRRINLRRLERFNKTLLVKWENLNWFDHAIDALFCDEKRVGQFIRQSCRTLLDTTLGKFVTCSDLERSPRTALFRDKTGSLVVHPIIQTNLTWFDSRQLYWLTQVRGSKLDATPWFTTLYIRAVHSTTASLLTCCDLEHISICTLFCAEGKGQNIFAIDCWLVTLKYHRSLWNDLSKT